jgi:hypothetical protein
LVNDGGNATITDALAVFPEPPFAELTAPDTLFFVPAPTPLTLTVTVQDPNGGIEPPDNDTVPAAALAEPPQPFDRPLGVFTTNPAGKLSLNPTPVSVVATFGFETVNVKLVVDPIGNTDFPNAFAIAGGATTTTFADAVFPVPPVVEDTAPEVFTFCPALVPTTSTFTVHEPDDGIDPPANDTDPLPATAVTEPPQPFVAPFGDATTNPAGRLSVNATPESAVVEFGFDNENVKLVGTPNATDDTPNALVMDGGDATTNDADAALPGPPSSDDTAPVVLSFTPAVTPCTLTENEQLAPGSRSPPTSEIVPDPATALIVPPPHEPLRPFGVATTRPAGNVSEKPT